MSAPDRPLVSTNEDKFAGAHATTGGESRRCHGSGFARIGTQSRAGTAFKRRPFDASGELVWLTAGGSGDRVAATRVGLGDRACRRLRRRHDPELDFGILGALHPFPPVNEPTGGPAGLDDNFMRLTSTGNPGPGGRMAVMSSVSAG